MSVYRLRSVLLWSLLVLSLGGLLASLNAAAQTASDSDDPKVLLDRAEAALEQTQKRLDAAATSSDFNALSAQVQTAQHDANRALQVLMPQLEQIQARLAQLGPSGAKGEVADIKVERTHLGKQQQVLDSARKGANLLLTEAQQLAEAIERRRAEQFSQTLTTRTASPLSPALWSELARTAPDDYASSVAQWRQAVRSAQQGVAGHGYGLLLTGVLVALLLALPLRLFLRHLGRRYASSRAPSGRLRRSGLALWFIVVGTATRGLAALVLVESLRASGALPEHLENFGDVFVLLSFVAAFIGSLGSSVLMAHAPSWRLLPLDDEVARRLRWHCRATALLAWCSGLVFELNRTLGNGAALTSACEGVVALLYVGLILSALAQLARSPEVVDPDPSDDEPAPVTTRRSGVIVLVRLLGHLIVTVALLAALFGYLNLALLLSSQVIWIAVVVGVVVLLALFVDDLLDWLFRAEGRLNRALVHALGIGGKRLEQVGVLVSAALRVLLVMIGLAALLAPYGSNLSLFTDWLDLVRQGLLVGDKRITPLDVGWSLAVLAIGLWLVNRAQRWLVQTYLPRTELEPSARNSVSTVSRYLGWVAVTLWALSALGIGMGQLALVVSALSVGIGFGLQAITQNFISGLILLAERPVKIGDWVRIGDQEGDVRRINVRATEIQVGDRSTLIVPNSELITKSVRNMTLANPQGRVQLQFSVPLDSDVEQVRALLLELYADNERTLRTPPPTVYIDSIDGGHVRFNSYVYVASPRDVYAVRSDLFFALLRRLHQAGIALQSPQDVRVLGSASPPVQNPAAVDPPMPPAVT